MVFLQGSIFVCKPKWGLTHPFFYTQPFSVISFPHTPSILFIYLFILAKERKASSQLHWSAIIWPYEPKRDPMPWGRTIKNLHHNGSLNFFYYLRNLHGNSLLSECDRACNCSNAGEFAVASWIEDHFFWPVDFGGVCKLKSHKRNCVSCTFHS